MKPELSNFVQNIDYYMNSVTKERALTQFTNSIANYIYNLYNSIGFYIKTADGITTEPVFIFNSTKISDYILNQSYKYPEYTIEDLLLKVDIGIVIINVDDVFNTVKIFYGFSDKVNQYFRLYGSKREICEAIKDNSGTYSMSEVWHTIEFIPQIKKYLKLAKDFKYKKDILDIGQDLSDFIYDKYRYIIFTTYNKKTGEQNEVKIDTYNISDSIKQFIEEHFYQDDNYSRNKLNKAIEKLKDSQYSHYILEDIVQMSTKQDISISEVCDFIDKATKDEDEANSLYNISINYGINYSQLMLRMLKGHDINVAINKGIDELNRYGLGSNEYNTNIERMWDTLITESLEEDIVK